MNSAVSGYWEAVEAVAVRMARTSAAIQVGAECDDLLQEGLIKVWQALEAGITPSTEHIENRMRDWIRHIGSQVGKTRDSNIPYEAILPLDDFRCVQAAV